MLGPRHLATPLCLLALAACETKATPADTAPAAASAAPTAAPEPAAAPTASAPPPAPAPPPTPAPDATPPADAVKTKSGLAMVVLQKGTGKTKPKATESVRVKALGFLPGGQRFGTPEPTIMKMSDVAPGWSEALAQMVEGEKRRLWMSPALAFGNTPGAPMIAGGNIVIEIELLAIPAPPPVPKDLKSPPKDAKKTESGLVYKVMTKGTGKDHPTATSKVSVHYSGWSQDGNLFDSSVVRGEPTSFALNQVIPGWTEGVQLLVVGDKARFWIPGPLAYGDKPTRPGAPAGLLVFDIELLAIR
jgi:FKBP-type peptidyl-prolyl cis-trans isomerase